MLLNVVNHCAVVIMVESAHDSVPGNSVSCNSE